MTELITEILTYIGIAALVGLAVGYCIWGWGQSMRIAEARAEGAASARTSVDGDAGLSTRLEASNAERNRLEAQVEALKRSNKRLEDVLARRGAPPNKDDSSKSGGTDASGSDVETNVASGERSIDPPEPLAPAVIAGPAPVTLLSERPERVDDLKRIKGVGRVMEGVLNEKGIYLFHQLAGFTPSDVAWLNEAIEAFPGRIERDRWVEQARELQLAAYGETSEDT